MALLTPWFWTSSLQNCERTCFCCFKPPSVWSFVNAASGNEYRGHTRVAATAVQAAEG